MKLVQFLPVAFVCAILGCASEEKPEATPVVGSQADTLDPEEIGIGKYVFEIKVPANKVMVLRRTEESGGRKQGTVLETIQFTNGGNARQVVLVYDLFNFPFSDRRKKEVRVRSQGSDQTFSDMRCRTKSMRPGRLTLDMSDDGGKDARLIYDCFVEDYEVAKARVANLPAISRVETWTFNASLGDE